MARKLKQKYFNRIQFTNTGSVEIISVNLHEMFDDDDEVSRL